MKMLIAAAATAFAGAAWPGLAHAEDDVQYREMIHCAATNRLGAGVLSVDSGAIKHKPQIDIMNRQAAALMAIAAQGSGKDIAAVIADTTTATEAIIASLNDPAKSAAFIATDVKSCDTLGQAAIAVIGRSKAGK